MLLLVNESTFKQEVLESSIPVIVHFWAPWCSLCKMIEPVLTSCQARWGEQIKLVGINADQSLPLASAYRLTTLPTIILFAGGEVRYRAEGCRHRDEIHKSLQCMIFKLVNPQSRLPQPEYDVSLAKKTSW